MSKAIIERANVLLLNKKNYIFIEIVAITYRRKKSMSNNHKAQMKEIWDRASKAYGKIGPKYWDYFGERLVKFSDIKEGQTVLDIGCGRGASLFPAAKILRDNGLIFGIDLSSGMVEETLKDVDKFKLNNVRVITMDAEKLKFEDEYFHRVLNGFGMGYSLNKEYKLSEVYRVLKVGGQATFCSWTQQEDNPWINGLVNKYIPQTTPSNTNTSKVPRIDTAEGVEEILRNTGFVNVTTVHEERVFTYKDEEQWWEEMWANAVRGILEKIQANGAQNLEDFKREAFEGLQKFKDSNGIHFKRSVIYGVGIK